MPGTNSGGEDRQGKVIKPSYGLKTFPKLPSSGVAQAGSISKILAVLSDLDWWIAGVSILAKDIQPHLMRVSSLLVPTLRGIYSSPAVQWRNSRYK